MTFAPLYDTFSLPNMRLAASVAIFCITCGLYIHYIVMHLYFAYKIKQSRVNKIPSTVPYAVPLIGNAISYLRAPKWFINENATRMSNRNPVKANLFQKTFFIVFGKQNITALWSHSSLSTSAAMYYFVLRHFFGMSEKAAARITKDDSGFRPTPHPKSNVEPWNRHDYLVFKNLVSFLSGPGLDPFFHRFRSNFQARIAAIPIGTTWTNGNNFWDFVTLELSPAVIFAMCGPYLLEKRPKFCRTFWSYNDGIPKLAKGLPRMFSLTAHRARDEALEDITAWHEWAITHYNKSSTTSDDDDPYWGSKFMRERQALFLGIDDFDHGDWAAEDLGAIYAACSNAYTCVFWALYNIFRDSTLLSRVRAEAAEAFKESLGNSNGFDVPLFDGMILFQQPLLQSIYSEILRLYVNVYVVRYMEREDVILGAWRLPKNHTILIPTSAAHTDRSIWNEGAQGDHPVDTFWAERFLVYPNDPLSGPCKKDKKIHGEKGASQNREQDNSPQGVRFSLDGTEGAWIPYGGGSRMCPGRHFSKRQIILTIAMIVTAFDVEMESEGTASFSNLDFGVAVQKPAGNIPYRIRRRVFKCQM